ncbi:MAG: GAF domain-containing protein [Brevibacterium sp.]|uniref:GAF domain-containing protein n=1 Tax=Brevibacterium sp. TaxID=1701 RepID=UPI002647AC9E|nr:helix-turn-helix domain-containing protein [Brevibacterium sp.]MDN5806768.1 GAF domain-containing protein [Brevibacterium sp.]MDN5834092.1 GAF domain-containing protein [Brevibacterium sp.]MDN5910318.1 GAF domain-containing protein [Brevibacterium sp.]MDN6122293.1 GAF domain-containing protein [Brevibacterium sp.]MDN6132743.1 GAF domain-containing protein [Brevibacterium sp.]
MHSTPLLRDDYQRIVRRAHDNLASLSAPEISGPGVRPAVLESWNRSLGRLRDPAGVRVRMAYEADQLAEVRRRHPFHSIMGLLRSHLIEPAKQAGLLVALGDEQGRLLWVEGERAVRNRAESMGFVPGTDWSEDVMGTSAPGLALRSRSAVQISQAEHFSAEVHSWSCSAVPVTHPLTGQVLGIIDVTGGDDAVSSIVLPLLNSTAQAAGAGLSKLYTPESDAPSPAGIGQGAYLEVTGTNPRLTAADGSRIKLSGRHAEIVLLLQRNPGGISGAGLVERLWSLGGSEVTVRAEIARLRRTIDHLGDLRVDARPYVLLGGIDSDVERVHRALDQGDVETALSLYQGQVLPGSDAPGVREIGAELEALMRENLLQNGTWQQLWRYGGLVDARDDAEVLMSVLRLAPPEAPERNAAVVRLEALGY